MRIYSLLLVILCWSVSSHAEFTEPRRVNADLVQNGNVLDDPQGFTVLGELFTTDSPQMGYATSPDSRWVVYLADATINGQFELFSAPLNSGVAKRLNTELIIDGNVSAFRISPDSKRVLYLADQELDGVFELYSVDIAGITEPIKLNQSNVQLLGVATFAVSDDSARVVYNAVSEQTTASGTTYREVIQSVSILGGQNPKILATRESSASPSIDPSDGRISGEIQFEISPNSSRVVSAWTRESDRRYLVFSTPIDSGDPIQLNEDTSDGGGVSLFSMSSSNEKIVYNHAFDIAVATLGGDALTPVTNYGVFPSFTNDDLNILYLIPVNTSISLFTQPIATPSTPSQLSPSLLSSQQLVSVLLSPDSKNIIMLITDEGTGADASGFLYSNLTSGAGSPILLNENTSGISETINKAQIRPDNNSVVFISNRLSNTNFELFTVAMAGGAPTRLNDPLELNDNIVDFAISPNNEHIVYKVETPGVSSRLYSVSSSGGKATQITPTLTNHRGVDSFEFSENSQHIVLLGDLLSTGKSELFTSQLEDTSQPQENDNVCPTIKTRLDLFVSFCL